MKEIKKRLVNHAAVLGEIAADDTFVFAKIVAEDDAIGSNAKPVIALQFTIEGLDVALLIGQLAQGIAEPTAGLGRRGADERPHLFRDFNLHPMTLVGSTSFFLRERP